MSSSASRLRQLRAVFLALAGLVAAVVATATLAPGWRAPEAVRIGVAQPLSGELGAQGADMLNGVTLAIEEINAAGGVRIGGREVKLEVVSVDDKADPVVGKAAAAQLVAADVLVAIADLNSGVSIAAAPTYAAAGIPQLAISTKPLYTRLKLPTTLRLVANDDLQSRAIGEYARQLAGAKAYAVLDDGTPYGKGLADDVVRLFTEHRATLAVRRTADNKTNDFESFVAEVRRTQADVIVAMVSDFQAEALIRQLVSAGLSHVRLLGSDTLKTDKLLQAGRALRAVYVTSPILEVQELPAGKAFLEKFRARFRGAPVYGAHYAYDAVYLVADALARNGSVDKAALLNRLKSFDGHAPVTGSMRFGADGEQRYGAVSVYQLSAGRWLPVMRSDRW
ncbi:branched-chain amino acid ABC transporter substrate-binding protein [Aquincola sp. S2]|uniref:Branched-chain amino acid ABC transporter substrate-binding protein n=1 Tax=Pseudaquabacterium terrae TaxID=2732868 RepID=A0ABX2E989_9BURK|nr:branched-chain amino acid ABC transporter substrate-binding protein [Aquabacterium terrae]NRF65539.1 branched-chain amino acid ABC transporter substrate-binding protein [Aquabacterium terrae]